jgi:hypothetical protein
VLFCHCEFGDQAIAGDSIFRTHMLVGSRPACGLVDQGGEVFVPLLEVTVHAGPADHDTAADVAIFSEEFVDRAYNRSPFGG